MAVRKIIEDGGRVYFRAECLEPLCRLRSHRYVDPMDAMLRLQQHRVVYQH